jgi:hypothetical protein
MLPIVATLLAQGFGILGNAVLAKGQEVVEEKLGVKLDKVTPVELRQLEIKHEEWLVDAGIRQAEIDLAAEAAAQSSVTERWKADMLSDSWLSKNIRPLVLLYLLAAYTIFSVTSGFGFNITQAYVELLGQMLMLAFSAYFIGRSVEKLKDMHERGK